MSWGDEACDFNFPFCEDENLKGKVLIEFEWIDKLLAISWKGFPNWLKSFHLLLIDSAI